METAKIAFPPPPPTVNSLTAHQRSQLVRTTKKLSQVLGTTPQYIDQSNPYGCPLLIDLPFSTFSSRATGEKRRRRSASIDSVSSTSSFNHGRTPSPVSPLPSSKTFADLVNCTEIWRERHPSRRRPPLLRLALSTPALPPSSNTASVKPSLETIPASPASPPPYYTLSCARSSPISPSMSFSPPSFIIPSESARRKSKMDRLRRKLGDNVPVDLVFPSETASRTSSEGVFDFPTVIQIRVARTARPQDLDAIMETSDECVSDYSESSSKSSLSLQQEEIKRRIAWPKRLFGGIGGKRNEA